MSVYKVEDAIAERELSFRNSQGIESPAWVRIGRPFLSSEKEVWQCPYEIEIENRKKAFAICGVDSLQAIVLALKTIDVELEVLEKQQNGHFLFGGEEYKSVFDPTWVSGGQDK